MNNTITVTRKTTTSQSVALTLPFYGMTDDGYGTKTYFAITGESNNIKLILFDTIGPAISPCRAADLPENVEQISEQAFISAYSIVQQNIEERFMAACPSVSAPLATIQS